MINKRAAFVNGMKEAGFLDTAKGWLGKLFKTKNKPQIPLPPKPLKDVWAEGDNGQSENWYKYQSNFLDDYKLNMESEVMQKVENLKSSWNNGFDQ